MHRRNAPLWTVAFLFMLPAPGCNRPGPSPPAVAIASPEQVVAEFLDAVRTGDDARAAGLLTERVREQTTAMKIVVAPPGSETATFSIGKAEVAGNRAQVHTEWTDLDTDGLLHTDAIVWLLRADADGWRVWGMSHKLFADRAAIVLNFEDLQDMLRQQQLAEDELALRERQRSVSSQSSPTSATEPRR